MKNELRKKYLKIRKNIRNKDYLNKVIFNKVINNEYIKNTNVILCYVSFNNEVDTIEIIKYLLNKKIVAVPKIENGKMEFYIIKSLEELKVGSYNILEPITNKKLEDFNDVVSITPGVCFQSDGYRIGYGGGFYDKFYMEYPTIYKIGLCYKSQIVKNIEIQPFDIKVDEIISD